MIDPIESGFSITPSNTVDLERTTRGIYVGIGGDLKVDLVSGDTVTFVGLSSGMIHPIRVRRVYATGTDVDNILGLY